MRRKLLQALRADDRGVAAIEAALVCSFLAVSLMNAVEVCRYAFISTQVEAVTQAAAQAAVMTCDPSHTPVLQNCPGVEDALDTAAHSSSLGEDVNVVPGALTEDWYCVSGGDTLVSASGQNDTCANGKPGLYLQVRTTYAYQPLFPGLTIVEGFSDTIEHTAWMRTL